MHALSFTDIKSGVLYHSEHAVVINRSFMQFVCMYVSACVYIHVCCFNLHLVFSNQWQINCKR